MEPEYITDSVERKSEFVFRHVKIYNMYPGEIHYNPWDDFPELWNLEVHKDNEKEAQELTNKFYNLGPHPDKKVALPLVRELLQICESSNDKLTNHQRWERTAYQMPQDIGGPNKEKFMEIITQQCRGKVLEAMAGYNTYVCDSPTISEVVAQDYSRNMLLRYPYPKRTRILFDLNRISSEGIKMDFFREGEFQTITCCYGVNYLDKPIFVFEEFNRILSNGGKLLVLGNTGAGYKGRESIPFRPNKTKKEISYVGFSSEVTKFPELKTEWEIGDYYLVTGIKN